MNFEAVPVDVVSAGGQPIWTYFLVPIGVVIAAGLAAWVTTSGRREETRHRYADGKTEALRVFLTLMNKGTSLFSTRSHLAVSVANAKQLRDRSREEEKESEDYKNMIAFIERSEPRFHAMAEEADRLSQETTWAITGLKLWLEAPTYALAEEFARSLGEANEKQSLHIFAEVAAIEVRETRQSKRALRKFVKRQTRDLDRLKAAMHHVHP